MARKYLRKMPTLSTRAVVAISVAVVLALFLSGMVMIVRGEEDVGGCCVQRWGAKGEECPDSRACRPVRLIRPSDRWHTGVEADPAGLEALRRIQGPTALVTVIGRARTGKSYSLNRIVGVRSDKGFVVGHTEKPETIGAYLWPQPLLDSGDVNVIVVDTEGLGLGPSSYDKALLLIAALASSRLIYHLSELVYQDDVTKLYSLACLAEHYAQRGMLGDSGIVDLPEVAWVVQRFELDAAGYGGDELAVLFGQWIAERANPREDPGIARYNYTVKMVRESFPKHDAYMFPTATKDGSSSLRLDTVARDEDLDQRYVAGMKRLATDLSKVRPKTVAGRDSAYATGADLADLIEALIPAANDKKDLVGDLAADAILGERAEALGREIREYVKQLPFPMDATVLDELMELERKRAMDRMRVGRISSQSGRVRNAIDAVVNSHHSAHLEADALNYRASEEFCSRVAGKREKAVHEWMAEHGVRNAGKPAGSAQHRALARVALDEYDRSSIGPAKDVVRSRLESELRHAGDTLAAREVPKTRIAWLVGSVVAAVLCHVVGGRVSSSTGGGVAAVIGAAALTVEVGALMLIGLIVLTIFGDPSYTFEDLCVFVGDIGHASKRALVYACGFAAAATIASLAVSCMRVRRNTNNTITDRVLNSAYGHRRGDSVCTIIAASGPHEATIAAKTLASRGTAPLAVVVAVLKTRTADGTVETACVCVSSHLGKPTRPAAIALAKSLKAASKADVSATTDQDGGVTTTDPFECPPRAIHDSLLDMAEKRMANVSGDSNQDVRRQNK